MSVHRLEFPHTFDRLLCPNCGHRATKAPLLHPETGAHLEPGDQFAVHGYAFATHADLVAALPDVLAHLFSQPPEAIHLRCPRCDHHDHGAAFGLHHHLAEV